VAIVIEDGVVGNHTKDFLKCNRSHPKCLLELLLWPTANDVEFKKIPWSQLSLPDVALRGNAGVEDWHAEHLVVTVIGA
jgi:hypothetical protein